MVMKQYGFDFDSGICVQCHACEVACKTMHEVEWGIRWRRVVGLWSGSFPVVTSRSVSFSCMHCGNPPCEAVCPTGAIKKRPEDGIVVVDPERCFGCHLCLMACPFGVPQYGADGKMQKCDLCLELVSQGKEPACVATCPSGALRFGTLQELSEQATRRSAEKITEKRVSSDGRGIEGLK
jgi:anaerobic dimethyl sulfoxide reductase subunit B (iron-sulfur subunit)